MGKKITLAGFILNIAFWLGIFLNYSFIRFQGNGELLVLKILLFLEPVFYLIALLGYLKGSRVLYLLTILFLGVNALLSLADETGFYDLASLFLNAALMVLLLAQRRLFFKKGKSGND